LVDNKRELLYSESRTVERIGYRALKVMPPWLSSPLRKAYWRLAARRGTHALAAEAAGPPDWSQHRKRVQGLRDLYTGRRCFVIGGGPSLSQTPLDLLTNEVTIASNAIFLLFGESSFRPTFYTVEDQLVAEDRAHAINQLRGMTKVFPADVWRHLKEDEETIYVNFKRGQYDGFPRFSDRLEEVVYWGGTVTFMNLQLAWYIGCREVYLLGIDHSYQHPSSEDKVDGTVITSQSADVNHFHPDYFGPGYRWHDPRVDRMELGYIEARRFFTEHGGTIYNATVGGKLEVFPRVNLEDVIGPSRGTEGEGTD
jgi:hypothetical protein